MPGATAHPQAARGRRGPELRAAAPAHLHCLGFGGVLTLTSAHERLVQRFYRCPLRGPLRVFLPKSPTSQYVDSDLTMMSVYNYVFSNYMDTGKPCIFPMLGRKCGTRTIQQVRVKCLLGAGRGPLPTALKHSPRSFRNAGRCVPALGNVQAQRRNRESLSVTGQA